MNDADIIKLLASLGGPGILAVVFWKIMTRYMDAHQVAVKEGQSAQEKRIDALEAGHKDCDEERRKLTAHLIEAYRNSPASGLRPPPISTVSSVTQPPLLRQITDQ